jgi:hypothetical protein
MSFFMSFLTHLAVGVVAGCYAYYLRDKEWQEAAKDKIFDIYAAAMRQLTDDQLEEYLIKSNEELKAYTDYMRRKRERKEGRGE